MILGFDTSAAHCAAVLLSGGQPLISRSEPMSRGQAERLMPMLTETLTEAGFGWSDLAAFAVGTGPGNFTGLRVAVAAARGLALSTGLPAYGIDGFSARAEGTDGPALVCVPAPRETLHALRFSEGGGSGEVMTLATGEARRIASDEGRILIADGVGVRPRFAPAEAVARIAARRLQAGETPGRPAPFYVRPPDAAPPRTAPA